MSPSLIIDIETGPLADDRLMELWTSPPLPEAPAEFQPLRIRLKSRGDEKETEERIERARCAHLRKLDQHRRECQRIQDESFQELRSKAALSALTGEVLAIGYGMSGSIRIECQDSQRGVTERNRQRSLYTANPTVAHFDRMQEEALRNAEYESQASNVMTETDPNEVDRLIREYGNMGLNPEQIRQSLMNIKPNLTDAEIQASLYPEPPPRTNSRKGK